MPRLIDFAGGFDCSQTLPDSFYRDLYDRYFRDELRRAKRAAMVEFAEQRRKSRGKDEQLRGAG